MQILMMTLLIFVLAGAVSVALTRNLLTAAVVFMAQSLALSVIWILLESPDLSVTEAAVGTGIDSLLLFVTLKKIREVDHVIQSEKEKEEAQHGQTT